MVWVFGSMPARRGRVRSGVPRQVMLFSGMKASEGGGEREYLDAFRELCRSPSR